MANLFANTSAAKKRAIGGKHSPSSEGMGTSKGLSARAPAPNARKQTTQFREGGAAAGILGTDIKQIKSMAGNKHGIVSQSDKGSLRPRNYPDLSGVPVSEGGTQTAAKLREQQGTVDPAANAARRGKLAPGTKRASIASNRPDRPLATLLKMNTPPDSEANADSNNRKRTNRIKGNAPSTMLQGGAKLG